MNKRTIFFIIYITILNLTEVFAESSSDMLQSIRYQLPLLSDSPTGAIDSDGNYTKDSGNGLNCSGFAKWIVDGFYTPLTLNDEPKYISLQALRKKHPKERGTKDILIYEDSRDPYFGLDWTRNLAVELGKKRGENPSYKSYDVTDSSVSEYVMNCGYPLDKIEEVLKEQSEKHTDMFYLGSINGMFGKNPSLWQHYHIAVFIPYYENDELKIAVLERNKETSFPYLLKRYLNTYCHLVAISSKGEFELKQISVSEH